MTRWQTPRAITVSNGSPRLNRCTLIQLQPNRVRKKQKRKGDWSYWKRHSVHFHVQGQKHSRCLPETSCSVGCRRERRWKSCDYQQAVLLLVLDSLGQWERTSAAPGEGEASSVSQVSVSRRYVGASVSLYAWARPVRNWRRMCDCLQARSVLREPECDEGGWALGFDPSPQHLHRGPAPPPTRITAGRTGASHTVIHKGARSYFSSFGPCLSLPPFVG